MYVCTYVCIYIQRGRNKLLKIRGNLCVKNALHFLKCGISKLFCNANLFTNLYQSFA